MINNFLLDVLAAGAILSGILVITSKNPVIAVLFLISAFCNAAGYLLLLGVGFIGISYILVYVGAIAVLFLFVIMLINIKLADILEVGSQYTKNLPLALTIGSLFTYEIFTIIPFSYSTVSVLNMPLDLLNYFNGLFFGSEPNPITTPYLSINPNTSDTMFSSFLQIEALGHGLYTYGAILFILTSVVLLLSMTSPIFLLKSKSNQTPLNPFTLNKFPRISQNINYPKAGYHTSSISGNSVDPTQSSDLNPWLVTGFTDAEGCLSARLSNYKNKKFFIKPEFSFHLHINDLGILIKLRDFFGVGTVRATATSACFEVTGIKNLLVVLEHFKKYPLQSSKRHSLFIFSIILDMLIKKEHLTDSGFLKAVSDINFLNKPISDEFLALIEKIAGPLPFLALPPVPIISSLPIVNPYWIVGFIMGEGSFTYAKSVVRSKKTNETRVYFSMQMAVSQKKTDAYLLRSIANYLGAGSVNLGYKSPVAFS